MSRILVTGGLGFIGSHLVDSLIQEGHDLTVMDNLCSESSNRDYQREGVTYWIDDVRNINTYRYQKEAAQGFDVIYHLAALARIQPSFKDPLKYISIDAWGTANVLEFARTAEAKVVYAGSSSAYGGEMLNPYAFAKHTGERTCELYNQVYGLSTVIARFFNVYGDRQPTSGPYATVVGVFQQQHSDGNPLTITGTGEQRRDFTHVSDIVSGFKALGKGEWNSEIFQLGTGENYSINELAAMFGGDIEYIQKRPGEAWITLADYSEMREATGWDPQVSLEMYVHKFVES